MPKSRPDFWQAKFERNIERDRRVETELEALGWRVFVIWECETKSDERIRDLLTRIANRAQPILDGPERNSAYSEA